MRTALAMALAELDSPEATATNSTPPKVYMAKVIARSGAAGPSGKNPPWAVY